MKYFEFIQTIRLTILSFCLFLLALADSNNNLSNFEKTKAAEDWNIHGPWIVEVEFGYNDLFIEEAHSKYKKKYYNEELKMINNLNDIHFNVKHSFKDETGGLNAVVLEGLQEDDLKSIKGFKFIQPDFPVFINYYSWGIHRITQPQLILTNPYSPAFKGCGVDVYVVDTGIDTNHIEFKAVVGVNRKVTNIYNAYGPITNNTDGQGHGTHCAGTVGGNTVGVANCSNIFGLKALSDDGFGPTSNIIAALSLIKARHISKPGSKTVVSMSLGGPCAYKNCAGDLENQKINEMVAVGIVFAVAAGNEAINAASVSPASAKQAITVAASTSTDTLASYSNFGSVIDIIAPGSDIWSGWIINYDKPCSKGLPGCPTESDYSLSSGTSMACPHVAGVLAQNMEKMGGYLNMTTQSDSNMVGNAVIYNGVANMITLSADAIGNGTINLLLQTPKNDNIFANRSLLTPTFIPTQKPTKSPTSQPVTSSPSTIPTSSPSVSPTSAIVTFSQPITGISYTNYSANMSANNAVIISTIATSANCPITDIINFVVNAFSRRLLSDSSTFRRKLPSSSSITATYKIKAASTASLTTYTTTLQNSVKSGNFTTTLQATAKSIPGASTSLKTASSTSVTVVTSSPTCSPSVAPTTSPITLPSVRPTGPTLMPIVAPSSSSVVTKAPFVSTPTVGPSRIPSLNPARSISPASIYSFFVSQPINGISYAQYYNASTIAANYAAIINSIATSTGCPIANIFNFAVTTGTRRLSSDSLDSGRKLPSSSSVFANYLITATTSDLSSTYSNNLQTNVNSGAFTKTLQTNAITYKAPALATASSSSVTITNNFIGGPAGNSTLSGGAVAVIVFCVLFAVFAFCTLVYLGMTKFGGGSSSGTSNDVNPSVANPISRKI